MTMNGNGNFTGKVAFVTGAGGGIGRATALAFARARAHVAVADVSEPNLRETARLIEEHGGRALGVRCDVTRAEEVKGALDRTIEAFGRLDFAFNNAGVEQPLKPAADLIEGVQQIAAELRTPTNQLCFLLSCGYFKATHRFYPVQTFRPRDISYDQIGAKRRHACGEAAILLGLYRRGIGGPLVKIINLAPVSARLSKHGKFDAPGF
jgi:NAD(P)-dependent dehydrogenase (short-subunit alcohol dehydrogenase family)